MSAYGTIQRSSQLTLSSALNPTVWTHKKHANTIIIFHIPAGQASSLLDPELRTYLYNEFADEVERGNTYPQEVIVNTQDTNANTRYTQETFETYFFGGDFFIGIRRDTNDPIIADKETNTVEGVPVREVFDPLKIEALRDGRRWEDVVAGYYYIKPNYPGRSSHICNGGFVIPTSQRAKGFGLLLAQSFLHYAPSLGYRASVFNLVYVNNIASVRLWETLNFTQAGRIPNAGRLKRKDGQGEEYVDALVFYKSFVKD